MNTNGNQRPPVKLAAAPQSSTAPDPQPPKGESYFSAQLKQLSAGVRKEDVKWREGWRDRSGQTHYIGYDAPQTCAPRAERTVQCLLQKLIAFDFGAQTFHKFCERGLPAYSR